MIGLQQERLTPIKKISLPRLELLSALTVSRPLYYFCTATDFKITKGILWSDSTITLEWLNNNLNKWKTFVCNRIVEIHLRNLADHLTHSIEADELCLLDHWWNGTHWLNEEYTSWPLAINSLDTTLPETQSFQARVLTITTPPTLLNAQHFSTYWKLLHVTTWVFRFIEAIGYKRKFSHTLTGCWEKMIGSTKYCLRKVQHKLRVGDIVLLQGDTRPRHMWKRARIEVQHRRDIMIRGIVLCQPDGTKI
ncbi:hypothetical protein PR048_013674, partial [Dryococelus australis]